MNGEINPNANRMANFGANHMNSGGGNAVNMNEILPNDPTKEQKPKWVQQSLQEHEQKQNQIAQEHNQIIPESFKRSPAFQTNKANASYPKQNQNPKQYKPQAMHRNPPQQRQPQPQAHAQQSQPQRNFQPRQQQKYPQQQQQPPKHNNTHMHPQQQQQQQPQRKVDKPVAEPYYPKKGADPFDKYANNASYQRDLKDHAHGTGQKSPYNAPQIQQMHQQQPQKRQPMRASGKMKDVINAICSGCNEKITDAWTEDSRNRMFHNECFVCVECGSILGALGKYVTVEKGVICKACRHKQVLAKTK